MKKILCRMSLVIIVVITNLDANMNFNLNEKNLGYGKDWKETGFSISAKQFLKKNQYEKQFAKFHKKYNEYGVAYIINSECNGVERRLSRTVGNIGITLNTMPNNQMNWGGLCGTTAHLIYNNPIKYQNNFLKMQAIIYSQLENIDNSMSFLSFVALLDSRDSNGLPNFHRQMIENLAGAYGDNKYILTIYKKFLEGGKEFDNVFSSNKKAQKLYKDYMEINALAQTL